VHYATDAAVLVPGFGIPMVICGPGGTDMLHQPNEWVAVEQLAQATEIYADLARRLPGSAASAR
jgi:acetylornithine deacetylase